MPTTITGQNGAVIKQETKIPVTGCKGVLGHKENEGAEAQEGAEGLPQEVQAQQGQAHRVRKQARQEVRPQEGREEEEREKSGRVGCTWSLRRAKN